MVLIIVRNDNMQISRAVEAEVTRRLEERERELEREKEELAVQKQLFAEAEASRSIPTPMLSVPQYYDLSSASATSLVNQSQHPAQLPSGVLTPLLKRHQDLDNELKRRLDELEQK